MNATPPGPTWVAFEHHRRIAAGPPGEVIAALQLQLAQRPEALPVVLDAVSSERIELDWRQPAERLLALLPSPQAVTPAEPAEDAPRGPGRPKLGVTAREVTLLPRHWDWLARQPGGASVALRKLVQAAMREGHPAESRRQATDAAYRFMAIVGGDLPQYEAVSRALFAGDLAAVRAGVADWPADVSAHLLALAARVDAPSAPD